MKSFITAAMLLVTISCASFPAKVKTIGDSTYESLNLVSTLADKAVLSGAMSAADRQAFARDYMVPALTSLKELISIAQKWKSGDPIPLQLASLLMQLQNAFIHIQAALNHDKPEIQAIGQALSNANTEVQKFKGMFR